MTVTRPRTRWATATAAAAAMVLISVGFASAQSVRLGGTFAPAPFNGLVHRFPSIAFDGANDAYLVVWTNIGSIGARFVSGEGALLGSPRQVNTSPFARQAGAVRVACAAPLNACLIAWNEEKPSVVMARLVRYSGGNVEFLADPFLVTSSVTLPSAAPAVAYSSGSNEFLVSWTTFGAGLDIRAQRVHAAGFAVGPEIPVADTGLAEFFPSVAYNSTQNEFLVAYNFEEGPGSYVAAQRVQPGTGALIGGRSTLYVSAFEQYPEIAYDSLRNRYLAITWNIGRTWMLHGALADGNANPITGIISLASRAGGDGIGLAFSPVKGNYLGVSQSENTAEMWGVEIDGGSGAPGSSLQVTFSGTALTVQPRAAGDPNRPRWLSISSDANSRILGQFVGLGPDPTGVGSGGGGGTTPPPPPPPPPSGCPSVQPGPDWVCVNGNWLPPTTSGGGGGSTNPSCPSLQPASDWVCVGGNWVPPTGGSGGGSSNPSCPSVQPGPNWQCVNGNWLPPTSGSGSTNPSCPSVQPGPDWVCVNGNWLPGSGGGGGGNSSCPSIQPGPTWVCVNGNWLPGGGGGGGNSSCPSIQPGPDWVCVSGNWLPGGGGGGGGTSCVTPQPGPGWYCSNGNWLPGSGPTSLTSSCPSVQPAPDWQCVNGNWLPVAMVCPSTRPGPDWVCVSGNWLPPGYGGDD